MLCISVCVHTLTCVHTCYCVHVNMYAHCCVDWRLFLRDGTFVRCSPGWPATPIECPLSSPLLSKPWLWMLIYCTRLSIVHVAWLLVIPLLVLSYCFLDRSCDSYCLLLVYSWLTRVRSDTQLMGLAAVDVTHPKPFTWDEVVRWWLVVDVQDNHDYCRTM